MNKKSIINTIFDIIRNILIYGIIFAFLVWLGYHELDSTNSNNFLDKLSNYIGMVTIILFGVIGIFEFAYDNGLSWLVPPSFSNYKEIRAKKQMKYYIESYLKEEQYVINQYNNERISFFLAQLGLTQHDFELIKKQIVSIKLMPLRTKEEATEKLKKIIASGNIIFDQKKYASKKLLYKKVNYFIDFTDVMYVKEYSDELEDCMIMLIQDILGEKFNDINKIIIPYKSNRMLGFGVGEKTGKAIINVTQEPYIFEGQCWEGHFDICQKNIGIVIHDVLVTGEQVIKSINNIDKHCNVEHIFCLVDRVDNEGKEKLEKAGYKVHSLLQLPDSHVQKLLDNEDDTINDE